MKIRKILLSLLMISISAVAATFLYAGRASARAPLPPHPTAVELIGFGAITLTPGQGMRVNLVNAIENSTVRLSVKFIDKNGQVLKAEELSLGLGSTSATAVYTPIDIPGAAAVPAAPGAVHVIVESVPDTPEAPFPFIMPSFEIFDRKAGKVESVQASFQHLNSTIVTGGQ